MTSAERQRFVDFGIANVADVVELFVNATFAVSQARADDGELSKTELTLIGLRSLPELFRAISDVSLIPDELKGLSAEHVVALADAFFNPALVPDEWRRQFILRVIGVIVEIAHVSQLFHDKENWDNPPKAIVVS